MKTFSNQMPLALAILLSLTFPSCRPRTMNEHLLSRSDNDDKFIAIDEAKNKLFRPFIMKFQQHFASSTQDDKFNQLRIAALERVIGPVNLARTFVVSKDERMKTFSAALPDNMKAKLESDPKFSERIDRLLFVYGGFAKSRAPDRFQKSTEVMFAFPDRLIASDEQLTLFNLSVGGLSDDGYGEPHFKVEREFPSA